MTGVVQVIPYSKAYEVAWDDLVKNAKNGTILHQRGFMEYHADRYMDASCLIAEGDRLVGVFPANQVEDCVTSHGGLTFGGLLYTMDLRASAVIRALEALCLHYREMGIRKIHYKPVPHLFHRYPSEEDLYALFRIDARLVRRDLSSAIMWPKSHDFSLLRKRGVKKALRLGLIIKEGVFFNQFHSLLCEVLWRHGAEPVHSAEELERLQRNFPDRITLVGAFSGDRLLAGSWLFHFDGVTHTQYLASSEEGRGVGALDFVVRHIRDQAHAKGASVSFGSSTVDCGRQLNEGLIFQKEGFGARGVVLDQYEIDLT